MPRARLTTLTWSLIFGGMLLMPLGLLQPDTESTLRWVLVAGSVVAIAIGVILIWVRSTMKDGK